MNRTRERGYPRGYRAIERLLVRFAQGCMAASGRSLWRSVRRKGPALPVLPYRHPLHDADPARERGPHPLRDDLHGHLVANVAPGQPHDLHGHGPRRHGLAGTPEHVEDQTAEVGEPLRPVLCAHAWPGAGAAQDRYRGVEVEDVGPDRDRLCFKVGQTCGQLGALGVQLGQTGGGAAHVQMDYTGCHVVPPD